MYKDKNIIGINNRMIWNLTDIYICAYRNVPLLLFQIGFYCHHEQCCNNPGMPFRLNAGTEKERRL